MKTINTNAWHREKQNNNQWANDKNSKKSH